MVGLVGNIFVRPEGLACGDANASSGRFGDTYTRRRCLGYESARVPYFCIFRRLSLRPRWTAVAALRLRKIIFFVHDAIISGVYRYLAFDVVRRVLCYFSLF